MSKKLCKISKENFKKSKKDVLKLVADPLYICEDCLRVSNTKKTLCEPGKIKSEK